MIKLLRGDFTRLWKSKVFWLGVIVMLGVAVGTVYGIRLNKQEMQIAFPDSEFPPDHALLEGASTYVGIVIAVFIGLFVGTDYSSGTIRNKHIMGHSRTAMYFSDLIICSIASVIMHITYIAVIVGASALGIIDRFDMSSKEVLALILISTCSVLALTAIILLVCMLISRMTVGAVSAIVLSVAFIFAASGVNNKLSKDVYYPVVQPDGTKVYVSATPDDDPDTKRKILRFVHDLLPDNQLFQLNNGTAGMTSEGRPRMNKELFPLYSLSLIAISTTAGILVFRKKDIT